MRLRAIPRFDPTFRSPAATPGSTAACHIGWPLLAFGLAMAWLMPLHGDFVIADALYAWEGHRWALQHGWVTQSLVHMLGKRLSMLAWYGVGIAWLASLCRPQWRHWRRPLLHLLLATVLSTAAVGALKAWTNMDCPWDLLRYGGSRPFVDLFAARPALLPAARCFPAGHASAGYAWVALYFFLAATRPALRTWGLAVGIAAGLIFGVAQQLRGAHFLSHDLASLAICWSTALLLHHAMRLSPASNAAPLRPQDGPAAALEVRA